MRNLEVLATDGPTNLLTRVGSRDVYASKNNMSWISLGGVRYIAPYGAILY